MARQPTPAPRPFMRTYFVHDSRINDLAGSPVMKKDGKRIVSMTAEQAAYWIQQGAIGEKELTGKDKPLLAQMHGRKLEEQNKEDKPE